MEHEGMGYLEQVRRLGPLTRENYPRAGELLTGIKALEIAIKETFKPLKDKAWSAHKAICAEEKSRLTPLYEAEVALKNAIMQYELDVEADREALEARLAEDAAIDGLPTAPIVSRPRERLAGVSTAEVWIGEVVDLGELVRAVADGRAPLTLIDVNTAELNRLATAAKSAFAVPGCRAVKTRRVSARGR